MDSKSDGQAAVIFRPRKTGSKMVGIPPAGPAKRSALVRSWKALNDYLRLGPRHLLMYTAGRFQWVRKLGVLYYRAKARNKSVSAIERSLLQDIDGAHVTASLRKNGFCGGLQLSGKALSELRRFCDRSVCFVNGDLSKPFLASERTEAEKRYELKCSVGRYLNSVRQCPVLRDLVRDPALLWIARDYLGAEPEFIEARMWWSFASGSSLDQQTADGQAFHYDLDDYCAIAFFFYLSDVDSEAGPHVCVPGSHRRKPLRFLLSFFKSKSDSQIAAVYGKDRLHVFYGPAGFGFAEDIFCYHKGLHPKTKDRLLLQIRYRLTVYGGGGGV